MGAPQNRDAIDRIHRAVLRHVGLLFHRIGEHDVGSRDSLIVAQNLERSIPAESRRQLGGLFDSSGVGGEFSGTIYIGLVAGTNGVRRTRDGPHVVEHVNLKATAIFCDRFNEWYVFFLRIKASETNASDLRGIRSGDLVAVAILQFDVDVTNRCGNGIVHIRFETTRGIDLARARALVFRGDE